MTHATVGRKVWAIPLAEKGFVPISENNRVFWYLEDYQTGSLVSGGFDSKANAEAQGRERGYEVIS